MKLLQLLNNLTLCHVCLFAIRCQTMSLQVSIAVEMVQNLPLFEQNRRRRIKIEYSEG